MIISLAQLAQLTSSPASASAECGPAGFSAGLVGGSPGPRAREALAKIADNRLGLPAVRVHFAIFEAVR